MNSRELSQFAAQGRKTLEKARKYRALASDESLDEIDRARLLAAARAIEVDGLEWTQVVRQFTR